MFNFSGILDRGEWWRDIMLNMLIMAVIGFIGGGIQSAAHPRYYGGSSSGGLSLIAAALWLVNLAFYIRGMGITARRLRDAGRSSGQITAYFWLILIPVVSFFAMIAYFFIAGFSPSKIPADVREAEHQCRAEKAELREQAENPRAQNYESRSHASPQSDAATYDAQAKKWAEEEAEE